MLPIDREQFEEVIGKVGITNIKTATIRQICSLSQELEKVSGERFVHLELGNPGISAENIGIEAEHKALDTGIANKYPDINGLPVLKKNGAEFIKAFLGVEIPQKCVVPTVGSMQASFTMMLLLKMRDKRRTRCFS